MPTTIALFWIKVCFLFCGCYTVLTHMAFRIVAFEPVFVLSYLKVSLFMEKWFQVNSFDYSWLLNYYDLYTLYSVRELLLCPLIILASKFPGARKVWVDAVWYFLVRVGKTILSIWSKLFHQMFDWQAHTFHYPLHHQFVIY